MGKESYELLPAIFKDMELLLIELAGKLFLGIADGKVHRNNIHVFLERLVLVFVVVAILWKRRGRQTQISYREGKDNDKDNDKKRHFHHPTHHVLLPVGGADLGAGVQQQVVQVQPAQAPQSSHNKATSGKS